MWPPMTPKIMFNSRKNYVITILALLEILPNLFINNAIERNYLKRGLERNSESKNVLKFDVEKDGGIIFWENNLYLKIILLKRAEWLH